MENCTWAWVNFYCYPGVGTPLGAVATSLTAAIIALWAVPHLGRRLKRINSALDFSRRFQQLMDDRHKLHQRYHLWGAAVAANCSVEILAEADNFYVSFFDLLWNEYVFWRSGLLNEGLFTEWMQWRWYTYNQADNEIFCICGVSYRSGWCKWKARSPVVITNPFVVFLDKIHSAPNGKEAVTAIVKAERPPLWRRAFAP